MGLGDQFENMVQEFVQNELENFDFGDKLKEAAEEAVNDIDIKDAVRDELPDFDDLVSEAVDGYFKNEVDLESMAETAAQEAADKALAEFVDSEEFDKLVETKVRAVLKRVLMSMFDIDTKPQVVPPVAV